MIVHSPYVSNPARKPVRPPPPKFREKKPWETPTHRFITTMVVHSPWTPLPKKPTTQDKAMKTLHTASKLSKAGISVASASVARQSSILANKGVTKSKDVYAKTKEKYAARSASPTPVYTGAMLSGGQTDVVMADEHGVWPHM
ncbi:hypothetical protein SARC_00597 [Sphaeroforma arctica JP610]|uniref:Uncharacterized protein n=1 Tax=Sphaeroforma arctica JP610 TaxID=667725 RepID=A0A0L0GEE6_9EUKA|nr:hypothetical protein SARC_00597 [Sphaeroforma arctica JP610]KNC87269.1 hypothetical protein SARC_00597 [Sphaeroforma arctica JP610]|eukprot:XP_014161171.1 hypothetical protein SARC_00597 [Sphaeroforma arctica JP610]